MMSSTRGWTKCKIETIMKTIGGEEEIMMVNNDNIEWKEWNLKSQHLREKETQKHTWSGSSKLRFFSCYNYTEEQKVRMTATEFFDYTLIWWNKYQKERQRNEEPMVDAWVKMRSIMKKRYVPTSYNRDFQLELQKLTRGNRSVEEY